jgi:deoxyribose-phosphate aldolase
METRLISLKELAKVIDHSLLRPDLTVSAVRQGCAVAREYGVVSVCARPTDLPILVEELGGTGILVTTTIGFPHGVATTTAKVAETRDAVAGGAVEVDMVLNVGKLRSGDHRFVEDDIRAVAEAAHAGAALVKVIFENCYLNDAQKIRLCKICATVRADYVKTSTGYGAGGSTDSDLILMRRESPPHVKLKAAGGVRTLDAVIACAELGCDRIGASRTAEILDALKARLEQ